MLFKSVLRTLKTKRVQLILLGVIIMLSSFLYTTMDYSIKSLLEPTEAYFEEANQEDFAIGFTDGLTASDTRYIVNHCDDIDLTNVFSVSQLYTISNTCYEGVLQNRLMLFQAAYPDLTLEMRTYKDLYFDDNGDSILIRVLNQTSEINQTYLIDGDLPSEDNHITITEIFAKKNSYAINDEIVINDERYVISGFTLFPDYSLTVLSSDFIIDNKTQTLGTTLPSTFDTLPGTIYFEGAGTTNLSDEAFTEQVINTFRDKDLPFVSNVTLTINNMRSGAIYSELSGGRAMNIFLSLFVASIGLLIAQIMVSKILEKERGPIGILKSMGYSNWNIAFPYLLFIAIMAIPCLLIGYTLGVWAAEPFKNFYLEFYLLPYQVIEQDWTTITVAIVAPFLFIVTLSAFIILRMLRQSPVTLLNPQVTSTDNKLMLLVNKLVRRFNIKTKLKHLLMYRSPSKFFVYVIGMFFAGFMILFSLSMIGIMDRMVYRYYDQTDHESIGYCEAYTLCDVPDGAEPVIELPGVLIDSANVSLVGLDNDSALHPLYDSKDNIITPMLEEGLIISKSLHLIEGFDIGDTVELMIGDQQVEVEIMAVTNNYGSSRAYLSRTMLSNLLVGNDSYYNTVYSSEILEGNNYLHVIETSDILKQAGEMQRFMRMMVILMVGISIVIGGIVIYILTLLTIEDNYYNISLFKVMGYNTKEIDAITLGGYRFYGLGLFILSIPVAIVSFNMIEQFIAQFYEMLFPVQFQWWHSFVSIAMYIIIFTAGARVAKQHLKNIALQEAMKMYQV